MAIVILVIASLLAANLALLVAYLRSRSACNAALARCTAAERQARSEHDSLTQQQHLDALKDEFIATVSHEIRTPLTSIRGALGLLSAGQLGTVDAKAHNLLRIASTNTDRLVRLINDILDLERMDSGRAPLHLKACTLADLIAQAVDTMQPMADAAGVPIHIAPAPSIQLHADPDRIQQILCNLLSNAIKFSPPGAPVRLTALAEPTRITLRIQDAGRGIPADKLDTVFDRFHQVDPADAREKGGTGLGLSICRSIAAQHTGRIWAERNDAATPGAPGTTLLLLLPRVPGAAAPLSHVAPLPPAAETASAALLL